MEGGVIENIYGEHGDEPSQCSVPVSPGAVVRQRLKLTCSFYAFGHSLRGTVILLLTCSSFPR